MLLIITHYFSQINALNLKNCAILLLYKNCFFVDGGCIYGEREKGEYSFSR